ncbi:MAG TPA: hypothetical protein VH816_12540 [Gaiellaceae bacterium]|jgi:hypothetical protein
MNNRHIRALARFWWLLAIGLGIALIAAVEMMATISVGLPPKVRYRSHATFTATQQELVTTLDNPYLRTQERTVVPRPPKTQAVRGAGASSSTVQTVPQAPSVQVGAPNVSVLVRAANYYPYLIQSDPVIAIRDKMFGPLQGEVTAQALNSFQTATRYRPSTFPIIKVSGSARSPRLAVGLTKATVVAFRQWLTTSQARAQVPERERVLLQDLKLPDGAVASGGPNRGLGFLVAFAVLAAFGGLALILDNLFPSGRRGAAVAVPHDSIAAVADDDVRDGSELARDLKPAPDSIPEYSASEVEPARWQADRSRVHR